jgi:hypothetical protein
LFACVLLGYVAGLVKAKPANAQPFLPFEVSVASLVSFGSRPGCLLIQMTPCNAHAPELTAKQTTRGVVLRP